MFGCFVFTLRPSSSAEKLDANLNIPCESCVKHSEPTASPLQTKLSLVTFSHHYPGLLWRICFFYKDSQPSVECCPSFYWWCPVSLQGPVNRLSPTSSGWDCPLGNTDLWYLWCWLKKETKKSLIDHNIKVTVKAVCYNRCLVLLHVKISAFYELVFSCTSCWDLRHASKFYCIVAAFTKPFVLAQLTTSQKPITFYFKSCFKLSPQNCLHW